MMECDQVALLRLLIQEEIGTIVDQNNPERDILDAQLESSWKEFEDSFKERVFKITQA